MFKVGEVVKLKAVQGASQRTKNRIRERGDEGFTVGRKPQTASFAGNRGVEWVMLTSVSGDWLGWLPVDEVEIVNASR
jgi:hypothetical protein